LEAARKQCYKKDEKRRKEKGKRGNVKLFKKDRNVKYIRAKEIDLG